MKSKSDVGYFAFIHLEYSLLQLLHPLFSEVELALVRFRQPMRIAEHETAFALGSQQPYLLTTSEALLPIFLQVLFGFLFLGLGLFSQQGCGLYFGFLSGDIFCFGLVALLEAGGT